MATHESAAARPVADREAGALRRLANIMRAHPSLWFYHQGDPRGCALYVGRKSRLPKMETSEIARLCGENAAKTPAKRLRARISMHYSSGLAICA